MRAFLAVDLSDEVVQELIRIQNELKNVSPDVKWVEPDNIHLTLKFLGEIQENKIPEIENVIKNIAEGCSKFEVSLFKAGAFPKLDFPKVLWVGIDKNCHVIEEVAKNIEDKLGKIGFPKEERPFSAHLTIGRVRSPKNKDKLREKILACEVKPLVCVVDKIVLYRSQLTSGGAVYTKIYEAEFLK